MIHHTLKFLTEQLNSYINAVKKEVNDAIPDNLVVLESINNIEESKIKDKNNLFISLVNISEESAMKNMADYQLRNNQETTYRNPPVNLNLHIMVTAVMSAYEYELRYLGHAISFFQGKTMFSKKNSPSQIDDLPEDFSVSVDLVSLSFEQINYLWSTLGGKQHPFACYKLRIIRMERESTSETRGVIRKIHINT